MGNVSGREEKSKGHNQEECYIGCAHSQAKVSSNYPAHLLHNPWASQAHVTPSQNPNQNMQIQEEFNSINQEKIIPTVFKWIHGGTHVAVEGSWDNWRTRELLVGSGSDYSIVKGLNAGAYHYRFVVNGQWTYAPDLPHEIDDSGNVFNVLDLKDNYPENVNGDQEPEPPSSPTSSYNNATFTLEDFHEKIPEMPLLLQQMPLNQPSSSKNYQHALLQKPLSANLNHLYIKRDTSNQPVVALSSSQRFGTKFVTTVLYKPFKKVKK